MLANGIVRIPSAMEVARGAAMEKGGMAFVHYNHTDPCQHSRWTTRESYLYMYGRPWQKVVDFYSDLVREGRGAASLSSLFDSKNHNAQDAFDNFHSEEMKSATVPTKDKTGRWQRLTFKIVVSYHGGSFDGWQKQPGLNTVQGLMEKCLGRFVDDRKAQQLKDRSLPIEGYAVVAGRTDKGVTALQQVCSFYTWRKDVTSGDIKDALNIAAIGRLNALHVSEVSRKFHPNFTAKWRRYCYVFPLDDGEEGQIDGSVSNCSNFAGDRNVEEMNEHPEYEMEERSLLACNRDEDGSIYNTKAKPGSFRVSKVDQLIRQLEGKLLSYKMFARDTKASRSIGPPTECYMFHARAAETCLPYVDKGYTRGLKVMCIELVANRFLRKMVRVLVATAIREAAAGADDDALLKLMDATCRRATAPPAPPEGLCLVDVGYGEFKQENCLIV